MLSCYRLSSFSVNCETFNYIYIVFFMKIYERLFYKERISTASVLMLQVFLSQKRTGLEHNI